jgi:release factor glutamine methyltransferase
MPAIASPQLVLRLRAAGCVFAEEEAALLAGAVDIDVDGADAADAAAALEALVARRVSGEPLEQVLGWAEFAGLRILVEPGVFVPRRRTELLAEHAARLAGDRARSGGVPVVVDLCCGAGAIAAVVANLVRPVELVAADIDTAAVRAARRNLEPLGARVGLGDLFDALPADVQGRVDVLAVNAPYVPTDEIALMPPEAREYEASVALDGGADGLDVHRRVAAAARDWLAPGGALLIETSRRQAKRTADLMRRGGLETRIVRDDELAATVVIGRSKPV